MDDYKVKFAEYIKKYSEYMGNTFEDVVRMIERLRTETYNVLSYSYGKDSGAVIYACELLGIPIHEIVTADVWATDDIPADLPPMWNWKCNADKIIKDRYGIEVKHVCAMTTADKKYNPSFQKPLNVGGGTNAHTKMSCIQQYQINEQNNEMNSTRSTTNATEQKDFNTSTDSLADKSLGVTQNSKSKALPKYKKTYQDVFYRMMRTKQHITGFPIRGGNWCTSEIKKRALDEVNKVFQVALRNKAQI